MKNLLLIQDDASGAKTVQDALARARDVGFNVDWVNSFALGLQRLTAAPDNPLAAGEFDLVLIDLSLRGASASAMVDQLYAAVPHIPIVILSSLAQEALAKAAIQRGAQDFLLKERLDDYVLPKTLIAAMDRAALADSLYDEKERAQITLNSIGDAVISTDIAGRVTYLNIVAERLTGWAAAEAIGRRLEEVFRIVDSRTRQTIPSPMTMATNQNRTVGLPPTCILIRRDGFEAPIEDSSAPIHNRGGKMTGAVMVFHDVSAARASTLQLAHFAQHDSLTDLPNRALLNDRLTQAITAVARHHSALAILYLDLDRFKLVNDSLGHRIGDRLLQSVALRLSEAVRGSDTVSRLGGDEFVVVLSEVAHAEDAALCAEKIRHVLRQPHIIEGHELHITASIGIAIHPEDGADVEALLQNADSAMYEAKGRGRDNSQFYRSELNSSASERQTIESGLRHAIERRQLELHFQPIVTLATGVVTGAEALLRWNHPELGAVEPERFVPIAEESGLIVPIGRWVLREACLQARKWRQPGRPLLRLAVNISAVELRSPDFVSGVAKILKETGFDPCHLELELTETFLMQDAKATAIVLMALKALGVRLALDDFGTGYSSLSYMRRFPIDALKVDRSFVRGLTTDSDDASVVSAVINMGKSLHMRVVAEGVETGAQLAFLEDHACMEAQGYHFSPPLTASDFVAFMQRDQAMGFDAHRVR